MSFFTSIIQKCFTLKGSFTTVVRIVEVKFLGVFLESIIVKSHFNYSHDGSKKAYVLGNFGKKNSIPTNEYSRFTFKNNFQCKVEDLGRMSFVELVLEMLKWDLLLLTYFL